MSDTPKMEKILSITNRLGMDDTSIKWNHRYNLAQDIITGDFAKLQETSPLRAIAYTILFFPTCKYLITWPLDANVYKTI